MNVCHFSFKMSHQNLDLHFKCQSYGLRHKKNGGLCILLKKMVCEGKTVLCKLIFNAKDFEMGYTLSQHHIKKDGKGQKWETNHVK